MRVELTRTSPPIPGLDALMFCPCPFAFGQTIPCALTYEAGEAIFTAVDPPTFACLCGLFLHASVELSLEYFLFETAMYKTSLYSICSN